MHFIKKLFSFPSPQELGWSKSDALPMDGNRSWDAYYEKMKKEHPIKYFFIEILYMWFRQQLNRISNFWYFIVSHIVPSRRYHMLDLRQPKNFPSGSNYRYGWIEFDNKILFALFNSLNHFIEHESAVFYCPSEEEIAKDSSLELQRLRFLEVKLLYYWWNIERIRDLETHSKLLSDWSDARKIDKKEANELWAKLNKSESELDDKEEKMIQRLIAVRKYLWT